MKVKVLTLTFALLSPGLAKVQAQAIAGDAGQVSAPSSQALQVVIEQDERVKQFVNECYNEKSDTGTFNRNYGAGNTANVADCLWEKLRLSGDRDRVVALIQQAQEAEAEQLEPTSGTNNLPLQSSFSGANFDSFKKGDDEDGVRRKALDKLGEIYAKKLEEELKPTDSKLNITDQQVFFELAKTQLGKNVITAWSSVCMDAGWVEGKVVIFDKSNPNILDQVRAKNIDALSSQSGKKSSSKYFECVASLPMLCHKSKGKIKQAGQTPGAENDESQIQAAANNREIDYRTGAYGTSDLKDKSVVSFKDGVSIDAKTSDDDDKINDMIAISRRRACETIAYVDGIRRQLAATEKLATIMQEDDVTRSRYKASGKTERAYGEVDIDKLTTVTSGELTEGEDGYYATVGADIQLVNECKQNPSDPRCAQLVADTQEEKDKLRMSGVAFMIESKVYEDKLKNLGNLSDDEKRLLLRRLRPDIDAYAVDDINAELEKISRNFNSERESLIESLSQQVSDLEVTDPSNQDALRSRVESAGNALLKRGNEYVQLMHFNNVISGYFDVEGGRSNVRVLDLELGNVANLSSGQGLEQGYGRNQSLFGDNYSQTLQENINRANNGQVQIGSSGDSEGNTQVNLSSGQISQFLDYEVIDNGSSTQQQPAPPPTTSP